ncbi:MAG: protein phosphatase 2C domain-containing protein [Candidatus Competibacter sp.]|nr:protein phosphatase 2C domain-containing protein [Candidatus Competibacter sp.]MDG4585229.1 protein phosphatase 2C domain-containing protein [Candidatus Competibacter sp.]
MSPTQSSPIPQWEPGTASQQGGRHEQQDRWGIFQRPSHHAVLVVVADGMGGHLDGALGAQIVIDVARDFIQNSPIPLLDDPTVALDHLCQQMHDTINRRSETARSTVVVAWLDHDSAYWLNIGDSRLYHFRRGRRLMRTRDHSAVQLLMDMGEIDESQMATHPAQNRIYRCLGGDEHPRPDKGRLAVQPGDLLALCSDGVWEHVAETEFWSAATEHGPAAAAQLLAEQAVLRGGAMADNATLVLLRAGNAGSARAPWLRRLSASLRSWFDRDR